MDKREKVIRGLECCTHDTCVECPYKEEKCCTYWQPFPNMLLRDALELLKAQDREIDFLKQMQLQLIQGMDEQKLGNMVGRAMKWDG